MDYSQLSDEELMKIANTQPEQDYSKLSDEELYKLAGSPQPTDTQSPAGLSGSVQKNVAWDKYGNVINLDESVQPPERKSQIGQQGFYLNEALRPFNPTVPMTLPARKRYMQEYRESPAYQKELKPVLQTAAFLGGLRLPTVAIAKAPSLVNALLTGASQGGAIGGAESLIEKGLKPTENIRDIGVGAGSGMTIAGTLKAAKPAYEITKSAIKGLPKGILESVGNISENTFKRMKTSPRGIEISKQAENLGSESFINEVANKFKSGVNTLRQNEIVNFAKARDELLKKNIDTKADLTSQIDKAFNNIKSSGFINPKGNLTPSGQRASGLTQFLDDLNYYRGSFDIAELQNLKTNVLDDIINYKPQAGQSLNNSTRMLQKVAKELRKDIDTILNNKLGKEYTQINKKLSEVLNILDNNPEIKDLTNAKSIDTLATKLKRTGTTRIQTANDLEKLEKLMNESGINISDYTLMDDILDYTAAKEIYKKIQSGQGGGMTNIVKRTILQPALENIALPISKVQAPRAIVKAARTTARISAPARQTIKNQLTRPNLYNTLLTPTLIQGAH